MTPCPAGEAGFSHTDLKSQPEISEQAQFYHDFDLTYRSAALSGAGSDWSAARRTKWEYFSFL